MMIRRVEEPRRVAIFVNTLANKGGVERIVMMLCQKYNAHVYAGQYDPESTFSEFKDFNVTCLVRGKRVARTGTLKAIKWFYTLDLRGQYDVFINMGGIAPLGAIRRHRPHLMYACMPVSWLYHRYDEELARHSRLARPLWHAGFSVLRWYDREMVKSCDRVCVISKTTQENFGKHLGLHTFVIYPPTDISGRDTRRDVTGKYYLWVGRMTRAKRPHTVLEAFRGLPLRKLRMVGNGEMLDELRSIAPPNVEVVGPVSEEQLKREYDGCIAAVYVSTREDYGYVPIEAFASGKPCISTNEAGFKETIIHGKTGLLVTNPTPESVRNAVECLTPLRALVMKPACLRRAKKFDDKTFFREMDETMCWLCEQQEKNVKDKDVMLYGA